MVNVNRAVDFCYALDIRKQAPYVRKAAPDIRKTAPDVHKKKSSGDTHRERQHDKRISEMQGKYSKKKVMK